MKYLLLSLLFLILGSWSLHQDFGLFEGSEDIGDVKFAGSADFNPADSSYTIRGGGSNMWYNSDEFHFVWRKMSGNVSLSADIDWIGEGRDPHRKACLQIRQTLDPGSSYVDAAVHGDGLTSLQFREILDAETREIQANLKSPGGVRIEKEGEFISMYVSSGEGSYVPSGASVKLSFRDPYYIGLGVCAHNNDTLEIAKFTRVRFGLPQQKPDSLRTVESTLEIIPVASGDRRVVFHTRDHIEAPNWTPDGKRLIYNSEGLLYSIPVEGGESRQIPTGFATRINNDHGISPDGTQLVISDGTETGRSLIYTLPVEGGTPKKITPEGPSYWHGWSPDGSTLAYCAERGGNYDIYTIPVNGGEERRLTSAEALDDGPDYSPDGKHIYFNSARTGTMQVWRMLPDGSEQEQLTTDKYNDWFPHPSPDGKWIAFITFGTDVPADSHPPNKDVMLRLMDLETREITVLAKLFGGQGTINVPSWSPDSSRLAFVSYLLR